jgi:hypothetical protein
MLTKMKYTLWGVLVTLYFTLCENQFVVCVHGGCSYSQCLIDVINHQMASTCHSVSCLHAFTSSVIIKATV